MMKLMPILSGVLSLYMSRERYKGLIATWWKNDIIDEPCSCGTLLSSPSFANSLPELSENVILLAWETLSEACEIAFM
jgi:hypothetical protein